ncbi:MAG: hypothetical protein BV457_04030 [Thermoplasmata archaeon M9B1D]|nr:MAG: hypothetical protein BV457_04030 [Thermoplasmata archaeon M9B1D]
MADTNKILTIFLAVIICVAAVVLLYVNLPKDGTSEDNADENDNTNNNETVEPVILLKVIYNNTQNKYTLEDLENFSSTTGTARYMKASLFFSSGTIMIIPPMNETANEYTGVKISTIIENIENLPERYNVTISARDGYGATLNNTEINGNMVTYTDDGNETNPDLSVILAYKQNGEYLSEDDGPLMVAIVGDEPISLSNIWVSNVVLIEITA